MQILIVHHEPEVGEILQAMVQEYTGHTVDFVATDQAALEWAGQASVCQLLVTQLESEGVEGLTMAGSLGERFPHLHTLFLPAYPLAAQRLEVGHTKIFPEPIDGERLLQAIERSAAAPDTPDLFHLIDLLQMCCLSGKSGAVQLVAGAETGLVYLRNGELRDAETARARGLEAIYEMLHWGQVEFAYDANASPTEHSIDIGWDAALIEVVMREREEQALRPGAADAPEISAALLPPEPDLTGQPFGTYRVGRKLTESFWDKVYEAEQTSIGRPVALHVLRSSLRQSSERAQEFLDTASVNANIRHPAILPVYEAGEYDGTYFYAREFVVGQTVYEIKASGLTITETTALRIVRAIADGPLPPRRSRHPACPAPSLAHLRYPARRSQAGRRGGGQPGHGPTRPRPERNPDGWAHAHPDDQGDRHPRQRPRPHPHSSHADHRRERDQHLERAGHGGEKSLHPVRSAYSGRLAQEDRRAGEGKILDSLG